MIEAAYRAARDRRPLRQLRGRPGDLGDAVRGARAMGWAGFNCSIPHKVAVIEHLDELAESASVIGAVNCAVAPRRRLIGENTDGKGFLAALRTVVDPSGPRSLVVFGAGGAARAIAVEAALAGAALDHRRQPRRRSRAELAELLDERTPPTPTFVPWRGPTACPRAPTSSSTPRRSACSPTSTRG